MESQAARDSQDLNSSFEDRSGLSLAGGSGRTSADGAEGLLGEGSSVTSAELPSEFFESRGVLPKIAAARPYLGYEKGDPTGVLCEHWPDSPRFAQRIANQGPGIVIPRYPPPALRLKAVPAELRPLTKDGVVTSSHWHFHGDERPEDLVFPKSGKPLSKKWIHTPERMARHIDKVHGGVNVQTVHLDENRAKYVFPPGDGAKRLDVHPHAWTRFINAPRVFFVIEGCIKSDAVLSAGEAVFSVPSVTLWNAPELGAFTRLLAGKVVYIVPDADWIKNGAVITQAMFCRSYLRRHGITAYVAAPPIDGGHKGVDDHLGHGGTMSELTVLERETPFGLAEWLASKGKMRRDRLVRDADFLRALAEHAGPDGTYNGPLSSLARTYGTGKMNASRATRSLQELGAVEVDGSLDVRHHFFDWKDRTPKGLDWTERPTIRIHEDLRAKDTFRPLGD